MILKVKVIFMKIKSNTTITILCALFFSCIATVHANSTNFIDDKQFIAQSDYKKKMIFKELVRLQDAGLSKNESEAKIMNKYKISYETLLSILMEGVEKNWLN
jgi:hypothetical protein